MKSVSFVRVCLIGIFLLAISFNSFSQDDSTISKLFTKALDLYYKKYGKVDSTKRWPDLLNYFVVLSDSLTTKLDLSSLESKVFVLEKFEAGKKFATDNKQDFSVETLWYEKRNDNIIDVFIRPQYGSLIPARAKVKGKKTTKFIASFSIDCYFDITYDPAFVPFCRYCKDESGQWIPKIRDRF